MHPREASRLSVLARWLTRALAALVVLLTGLATLPLAGAAPTDSPSASGTPDAGAAAAETADYGWLWAIGGVMVVLLIFVGWRFLLGGRRS